MNHVAKFYVDFRMKIKLFYFLFLSLIVTQVNASVMMTGTRIIYPSGAASKTIQFSNPDNEPAIIQLQMVNEDGNPDNETPFVIIPPVFRIEPHSDQSVRIITNGKKLPTNKESLFKLQFQQLPSIKSNEINNNKLFVTIKNNVKIFYRPESLTGKRVIDPPANLQFEIDHRSLTLKNPTGFFISIVNVEIKGKEKSYKVIQHVMLAPFSSFTKPIPEWAAKISKPKIKTIILNDSGAEREIG